MSVGQRLASAAVGVGSGPIIRCRPVEHLRLSSTTGMGVEQGFWAMARAVAELLPDGNRERTMLLGLTGNRDALSEAADRSSVSVEAPTLFGS